MEGDLWGNPVFRSDEYHVFHDESIPNKRWLLVGLLFVSARKLDSVKEVLQFHREQEGYWGEIHFSQLPKSFGGQYGAKARVARRWMQAYQDRLYEHAFFSCLAVDRHSPGYDHRRFTKDFHAYNRFTAIALKAGIVWHLGPQNLDELELHFVSDAKDRITRPDQGIVDNFEEYLPYRAEMDAFIGWTEGKPYPSVTMSVELEDSAKEDPLQLTDLLLGATQMALVASSSRKTKRTLGEMVVLWHRDLQQAPWEQRYRMHRKFNLWAFPDANGNPYNHVDFSLRVDDGQQSLF